MPLDYTFHRQIGTNMLAEEKKKRIGNESYAAFKQRLLRHYKLPKKTIDKGLGSMPKRVLALHKAKGGITAYDRKGNSKTRVKRAKTS